MTGDTSRRQLLGAGAGLALGGVAGPSFLAADAYAQGGAASADAELAHVQGARRILLRGGVVLTLDPQVGDFALGDVLIEDGKIREVRSNIAASGDDVAVIDAAHRVIIPGFIDTHSHSYQGLLRNILVSSTPA
jgi:imidazolonepropionase-like amidohydrolase